MHRCRSPSSAAATYTALIGGLVQSGHAPSAIRVIEPFETQAGRLRERFGVRVDAAAGPALADAALVVWAVKPQLFREAAAPCALHVRDALQLSVMAGIRSGAMLASPAAIASARCPTRRR
jgi:pyrroline-5-carboxylate reductase